MPARFNCDSISRGARPVCLWYENPNGLVSGRDVERFSGEALHTAICMLEYIWCAFRHAPLEGDALSARWLGQTRTVTSAERKELEKSLLSAETIFRNSGLASSAGAVAELRADQNRNVLSADQVASRIEEIRRNVRREMTTVVFLYVPASRAELYDVPLSDWETTVERWSQTETDIKEAAICYALDRFAASIFHILRVAEFGVIQVADLLNESGDKPGWASADRLKRILDKKHEDRSPLQQRHSQLLMDIVPMIVGVRDSVRHKISHVDNRLDWLDTNIGATVAQEVISATRGFMRRLAAELPKASTTP